MRWPGRWRWCRSGRRSRGPRRRRSARRTCWSPAAWWRWASPRPSWPSGRSAPSAGRTDAAPSPPRPPSAGRCARQARRRRHQGRGELREQPATGRWVRRQTATALAVALVQLAPWLAAQNFPAPLRKRARARSDRGRAPSGCQTSARRRASTPRGAGNCASNRPPGFARGCPHLAPLRSVARKQTATAPSGRWPGTPRAVAARSSPRPFEKRARARRTLKNGLALSAEG